MEHLAHWAEFWAKKRPRKIILGQSFWANFSGLRCRRGGGTQWCPVVQLGDGLWVTFTSLPQAVVLGGWSQNLIKTEGPQIHFVVQPKDK